MCFCYIVEKELISMYETKKVFDSDKMPENIQQAFFDGCGDNCHRNSSVEWQIEPYEYDVEPLVYDSVSQWLIDNGADADETVLIHIGW